MTSFPVGMLPWKRAYTDFPPWCHGSSARGGLCVIPGRIAPMKTAAEALIEFLAAQGIDRAFCVPGESYIALLDALHAHPRMDLVTCRSEGGAGF
ncbi:MAG: thiamine pyrophosphate-binding protein, partial [Alphaproteobacteria bacterium]